MRVGDFVYNPLALCHPPERGEVGDSLQFLFFTRPFVEVATDRRVAMPVITLPDGSRREYPNPITVAEIAASIGAGLAKAALAGKVDGKMVDTSYTVTQDAASLVRSMRDGDRY